MSITDEIKDRIDLVDVVSETVKLRKSGKNYLGFCPFHTNMRTPAFVVFPETGTWRCFGACNEGGDVFRFLMKKEGWDFSETLRYLAQRAGVELQPQTPQDRVRQEEHQRLRELLEAALVFYCHNLLQTDDGAPVLGYLRQRGLSRESLEAFEIGYAPNAWDATRSYLMEKGYSEQELLDGGLVSVRETGGSFDRFRHRIMIPIRDAHGKIAGFGARAIEADDQPKYLNSPQTAIFDKGRLLYGLDKARKEIRSMGQAVIVEGYMDVIGLHQAGYGNAISPMGTALSEHQLRLLKRYSRDIILALDPDRAGVQATLRGLSVARETFDREVDPVFDARGFIRHEGRLDVDMRIVTLPEGKDPDEVVAQDPAAWQALIGKAKPIIDYVLDVLSIGRDLDDPKVKSDIASQILPLIEDVGDSVERETYRQHLSRRLQVDERALVDRRMRSATRRRPKASKAGQETASLPGRVANIPMESFCLGLLLKNPELLYRIDRQFQALQLERVGEGDFSGVTYQMIFRAIQSALRQDEDEPSQYLRTNLEESLQEAADGMIAEIGRLDKVVSLELERPKVADEVTARFLQLRKRKLEEELSKLQFVLHAAEETEDLQGERSEEDIAGFMREVQRFSVQKAKLDQALARRQGSILSLPG